MVTRLYDLIMPNGLNPAWWNCPIQQGVPAILNLAYNGLLLAAGFIFLYGMLSAVYNYLTAYGDEAKVKKGRDTLKWTFIGALVVVLSASLIDITVNSVLTPGSTDANSTKVLNTAADSFSLFNKSLSLRNTQSNQAVELGKNGQCNETPVPTATPTPTATSSSSTGSDTSGSSDSGTGSDKRAANQFDVPSEIPGLDTSGIGSLSGPTS